MFRFHSILQDFTPCVNMYVLDARPVEDGFARVKLTVIVHPNTSQYIINDMISALCFSMSNDDLKTVVDDFGIEVNGADAIGWSCYVRKLGEPES